MKGFSTVWPAAQLMGAMSLGQVGRVSNVAPYRAAALRLTQYRVAVLGPQNGYDVAGAVAMTRYGSKSYSVSIVLHGLSEFSRTRSRHSEMRWPLAPLGAPSDVWSREGCT
jgi:hypothetical protein